MRKIIFLAIMVLAGCLTMPAQSNSFTAEVASVNSFEDYKSERTYHGVEVNGGYQFNFLKRIYVEPQIGLTWLSHCRDIPCGVPVDKEGNITTLGINIGATGGVKLCRYIGLFTGPDVKIDVYSQDEHACEKVTSAWWRFGLDVFVWKLRIRGSVDVGMNKPYSKYETNHAYTIGLAYQF